MVTVWHRGKTLVKLLLGDPSPSTCAAREPTSSLPYDVVEMIIANLTRDLVTLKACSLTCRSWYTAAAPHLHHTLTLREDHPDVAHCELKPLSKLYELGLMPLVNEIRVSQLHTPTGWFAPQAFSHHDLRYFSAFANVQTLVLYLVQLDHFVPDIKHYFEHFSSSLRSITITRSRSTPRLLAYFLSLFPNLDDIELQETRWGYIPPTVMSDTELVLSSAPKMRGRLVLLHSNWVETWTHLINAHGAPRFCRVDLRGSASCAPLLLEACAETIETLRFYATGDWVGKQSYGGTSASSS